MIKTNHFIPYILYTIIIVLTVCSSFTKSNAQWTAIGSGSTSFFEDVYFHDDKNGFVIGSAGTILRTTDGGNSWNTITSTTSWTYESISFPSLDTAYMVGGFFGFNATVEIFDWSVNG
ncbi:MAG: hypothetical protein IIA45_10790, partial [Bacteroidetes bacterium]|nr:hypothetical protein [Bacteroidota bacterium]